MRVFRAKNSNDMACEVYSALHHEGIESSSRNGNVLKFNDPVTLCYSEHWNRGNHTLGRDANPFFHVAEAMWMLAGRRDLAFLEMFNKGMAQYSDDGVNFNAAYGYRLRRHFGFDQLEQAVLALERDPDTRQVVGQMWDPQDLILTTKDKACNMSMVFSIVDEKVQMMIFNRSNDAVYGNVTGANPVHMSYFLQYVADQLGRKMGKMYFTTVNLHVYTDLYDHWDTMNWAKDRSVYTPYPSTLKGLGEIEVLCDEIMDHKFIYNEYHSQHIETVVKPLLNTWLMRKHKNGDFFDELCKCTCPSLSMAAWEWLDRREMSK